MRSQDAAPIDFVIFSPNFFPRSDAEAYCATRFASALAVAGHRVHVVTLTLPKGETPADYGVLVHPGVQITPVARVDGRTRWPHVDLRTMTVGDNRILEIPGCVAKVKEALAAFERPVLITRTEPLLAAYVGYACRKSAARWIAHFSDPIPWSLPGDSFYGAVRDMLARVMQRFWMRRVFKTADSISVTCLRARRFFRETYGMLADRPPWVVATHIGDTLLQSVERTGGVGKGVVFHAGDMYYGRGVEMLEAVERLNARGIPCELIQARHSPYDDTTRTAFVGRPHCHVIEPGCDPVLREKAAAAQVSCVVDFAPLSLAYSPRLLSKFAYQVYENRPIVVSSSEDGEMRDFCMRYPEAGLFFAPQGDVDALCLAIERALAADPSAFDRTAIRKEFSAKAVADRFVSFVRDLLGD